MLAVRIEEAIGLVLSVATITLVGWAGYHVVMALIQYTS